MFINIAGVLLVVTLTCHTQKYGKPKRYALEARPRPDGHITLHQSQKSSNSTKKKNIKFEDYLRKFEPSTVWEQIDKQKKYNGLILSNEEQSEIMYRALDPTDEIMNLNIENRDLKLLTIDKPDTRKGLWQSKDQGEEWKPDKNQGYYHDRFHLRNRFYQLMKQAIYTTRNKMVIMQIYREKYMNSSLYKMGYLFNKADNTAKTFGKFSARVYRACLLAREKVKYRITPYELLAANERQLNLWFNLELLGDLIENNDVIAKEIMFNSTIKREQQFDKLFIN